MSLFFPLSIAAIITRKILGEGLMLNEWNENNMLKEKQIMNQDRNESSMNYIGNNKNVFRIIFICFVYFL